MSSLNLHWLKCFVLFLVFSTIVSCVVFAGLFGFAWLCGFGNGPQLLCMLSAYASIAIPIVVFIIASIALFRKVRALDLSKKQAFAIAILHFLMLPLIYFSWREYGLYMQRKREALGKQRTQELIEVVRRSVQVQPLSYQIEHGTQISDKSGVFYVDTLEVKALVTLKHDPLFKEERARLYIQEKPNERIGVPIGHLGFENAKDNFNTYRRANESTQQFNSLPEGNLFLLPEGEYEVSVLCEYCLRRPADQTYSKLDLATYPYSLGLYLGGWTTAATSAPLSDLRH